MHRSKKKRNIVIISLIIILLAMVVGYATYSSNIELEGTTKITSNWDIRITNVTEGTPTGDAENAKTPTWKNTEASMEANLYSKGDAMEYDVTIENKGNLDAKLNDVLTNIENANSEAVNITFTGYTKGEILKANQKKIVHVKIEYNPNYEGEETSSEVNINFDYTQNNNETEGEENLYLIKYDCITNGGQDCSNNNEYLLTGSDVDLTKTGNKENAEFIGWNTNKDETKGLTNLKVENKDITLYAIFKSNDTTSPIIDNISTKATTNSITAIVSAHDDESGITKYEFSINNGEYIDNGNNNTYTFTNLKSDTNYTIKVRVTNGVGLQAEKEVGGGTNLTDDVVTEGDGLYKDEYEDRYIYKGKNVNNYITFNNETAGWRIVSIEKDGTIKIMRDESIGEMAWDSSNKNNWARPASLNTYLNESYLTDTLNATAQSQIVSKDWNIGGVTSDDTNLSNTINNENTKKWTGKVALITASEYVRSNGNKSECGSIKQIWDSKSCGNTTWMHNNSGWWTLSYDSISTNLAFYVSPFSIFSTPSVTYSHGIRPSVYLSSDLTLKGEGTKENPFEIIEGITLPKLQKPTFTEEGENPKTVTITYPEGCGENLTCTYQKDDEEVVKVNSKTVDVGFNNNGTLLAKVTDGTNEESNVYNVIVGIDITDNIVTEGNGLYKDNTEENRYVYKGASPNNYVTFNDELWRIISKESDNTMKIIKASSLSSRTYDNANNRNSTYCNVQADGCNTWGSSTTTYDSNKAKVTAISDTYSSTSTYVLPNNVSSLNTYLNGSYYNTLTETAQEQIDDHYFNIGNVSASSTNTLQTDMLEESKYKWLGKIGLLNITDYVKASNSTNCTKINSYSSNTSCYSNSKNHNWIVNGLSSNPRFINGQSGTRGNVWGINTKNYNIGSNGKASSSYGVSPVLYLKSSVKIISGEGTQSNPYQLQISKAIEKPTFAETGDNPKTVIITYPEGCGDKYTCSYKKDNEESVNVKDQTVNLEFTKNGTVTATVSDGVSTATNSYDVIISTGGNTILDTEEIVTSGDGLYKDEYEDRYFYRGTNPNNYITFNNETWRIVSIENDGTIKIMKMNSIENREWDFSQNNNWARPAALNTYLNESYLTETLNQIAQNQIVSKDWSIGSVTYNDNDLADQINDENSKKWTGKVALITASESIRSNSNQSSCGNMKQVYGSTTCNNTTWMYNSSISNWWMLSPSNSNSVYVFIGGSIGAVGYTDVTNTHVAVRPSVYLSSNVQITGGDGSQNNPYTLGNVVLQKPTFTEKGENPKTVTITYPEGCGDKYTCSYKKDNEESVNVTTSTVDVQFNKSGSIVATVSEGTNTVTSSYTVNISTAGSQILDKVEVVSDGNGLYKDEYEWKYTYKGNNPNNYIKFNNETWRIMSIYLDGTIKIMKDESIGTMAWDSSNSNNWARPSTLNTYLNSTYYNNLTSSAQSQVIESTYYAGNVSSINNNNMYNQINSEKSVLTKVKIALPTLSEYLRACSNINCNTYSTYNDNFNTCKMDNWMYYPNSWWTLTASHDIHNYVYFINSNIDGLVSNYAKNTIAVRPALTLSSKVKITGGDGSANNPYTLG